MAYEVHLVDIVGFSSLDERSARPTHIADDAIRTLGSAAHAANERVERFGTHAGITIGQHGELVILGIIVSPVARIHVAHDIGQ